MKVYRIIRMQLALALLLCSTLLILFGDFPCYIIFCLFTRNKSLLLVFHLKLCVVLSDLIDFKAKVVTFMLNYSDFK